MQYALTAAILASTALALPTESIAARDDSAKVTSSQAFSTGAGNNNNGNIQDGIGAGSDTYQCYSGGWQNYPGHEKWVSFEDMFNANKPEMRVACGNLYGPSVPNTSDQQIGWIYNSIQQVAQESLVDHRHILATIMQESLGCINVGSTTAPGAGNLQNPGLMQSHAGSGFVGNQASAEEQQASITQMIRDGTQGTSSGDGLVQLINQYGNIYEASRGYNSGSVDSSNLNNGFDSTPSYVNSIANRMTGATAGTVDSGKTACGYST